MSVLARQYMTDIQDKQGSNDMHRVLFQAIHWLRGSCTTLLPRLLVPRLGWASCRFCDAG